MPYFLMSLYILFIAGQQENYITETRLGIQDQGPTKTDHSSIVTHWELLKMYLFLFRGDPTETRRGCQNSTHSWSYR